MSRKTASEWLISQNTNLPEERSYKKTKVIAVSSGKGGVGKTSVAIKFGKELVDKGEKVLLIDCDYNLSNTAVKLGFPILDNFFGLLNYEISFEEALCKDGDFHILSACNGNEELYERGLDLEGLIIDIISSHGSHYDTVILDCPAGINPTVCTLSSYADYRFIVITPDRSSITDSYSLIKLLNSRKRTKEFHLIFNKVSNLEQYNKLSKTFLDTADQFLTCKLFVLGNIPYFNRRVDEFDRELLKVADSKIHNSFNNLIKKFSEKTIDDQFGLKTYSPGVGLRGTTHEHDVQGP